MKRRAEWLIGLAFCIGILCLIPVLLYVHRFPAYTSAEDGTISMKHVNRVVVGMTPSEVKAAWGEPKYVKKPGDGRSVLSWHVRDGALIAVFQEGRITEVYAMAFMPADYMSHDSHLPDRRPP